MMFINALNQIKICRHKLALWNWRVIRSQIECIPDYQREEKAKYPPIRAEEYILGKHHSTIPSILAAGGKKWSENEIDKKFSASNYNWSTV